MDIAKIACFKICKSGIISPNPEVMGAILRVSSNMLENFRKSDTFKEGNFKGSITTQFNQGIIGNCSGTIFYVILQLNYKSINIELVLSRPLSWREKEMGNNIFICLLEENDSIIRFVDELGPGGEALLIH